MDLRDKNNQKLRSHDTLEIEINGEKREGCLIFNKPEGANHPFIEIIPVSCITDLGLGKGVRLRLESPDETRKWKLVDRMNWGNNYDLI